MSAVVFAGIFAVPAGQSRLPHNIRLYSNLIYKPFAQLPFPA
jgi:hypothetical protein